MWNLRTEVPGMPTYIHQLPDWPAFTWDAGQLANDLADIRFRQGSLLGRMRSIGFDVRNEAVLQALTQDVLKTSEIEGERLDAEQVRSSIARRLGLDIGGLQPSDRRVDGVVEMMLDATTRFDQPLTADRLFAWQAALFPTGRSGLSRITVGAWRDDARGAMQVVSGPFGQEYVHYEAPSADRLDREMQAFLDWFNSDAPIDPVLKAGVAHLWFVTIHPFEDGNGRIARAIADLALARSEGTSSRFYSMSAQIQRERALYYDLLEQTQQNDLDITRWLAWFLACLGRAIERAEQELEAIFLKARFWEQLAGITINERQRQMLNRLLDGFDGKLTTSTKWARLNKTSQDTAYRDITDLIAKGILVQDAAGGRSTSYSLVSPPKLAS